MGQLQRIELEDLDGVEITDFGAVFGRVGPQSQAIACMALPDVAKSREVVSGQSFRVSSHVIIVPTAGTGTHVVDSEEYRLELGQVLHVLPGQSQKMLVGQPLDGWVLSIEPFVCPVGLFDVVRPSPVVTLGPSVDVANSLVTSLSTPDILPAMGQERLRISIASVLLELISSAHDGPEVPQELANEYALVSDFRRELEFHYLETRSVGDYASMVGCSAKTLTRATKRLLGQTPKEIIDARVTYAAIRLLANTDIPISWIAAKLGFSQQSNFAKFFSRQVDLTPAAYREASSSRGSAPSTPDN